MQENSVIQPAPPGTMLLTFGLEGDMWHELTTVLAFIFEADTPGSWQLANVVTTVQGEELYPARFESLVPPSIESDSATCRALVVGGRVSFMDHEFDSVERFLAVMREWGGLVAHMLTVGLPRADRAAWISQHDCRDLLGAAPQDAQNAPQSTAAQSFSLVSPPSCATWRTDMAALLKETATSESTYG